ncbi:hypothetical protein [Silicimonas sp. MF1-12-2]|uniref:hypothetical protein n=1 Tax=Silicimonas sp. MF1-12-2 TaxID=3384793 RepID=UPI0039B595CA
MGKALIAILGLVVGLVGGTVFGGSLLGGTAAGIGIATGLSAGVCSTITAAKDEGLLTDEQIAQVLMRATSEMGGTVPEGTSLIGSADECAEVMERLRSAAAE